MTRGRRAARHVRLFFASALLLHFFGTEMVMLRYMMTP